MYFNTIFPLSFGEFLGDSLQHILGHRAQIPLRLPAPLLASTRIIELVRPALGDSLLDRVHIVDHLEVRKMLAYLGIDTLGSETH
jgi:hypothetical protein